MEIQSIETLIVEDSKLAITIISDMLKKSKKYSFNVEIVKTLKDAEIFLKEKFFHVVLLDLNLPDSLGLDTLRTVHTNFKNIPIVVLTSIDEDANWFNAITLGAQDYLVKGKFDSDLLELSIRYSLEKKKADERLRITYRALNVRSQYNKALSVLTEEQDLLQEMCRIIVEVGGYPLTWIGFVLDDKNRTVYPIAERGFGQGFLQNLNVFHNVENIDEYPALKAIRAGEPFICQNIFENEKCEIYRIDAKNWGYESLISLPLISNNAVIGVLSIFSNEKCAFDDNEIELLTELANDLSYGISVMRLRVERKLALDLVEQERQLLAKRVKQRTEKLNQANAALAKASRLKDEFLANMSHELRTPLNSILGLSEVLQEGVFGDVNDKQIEYLKNIEESGRHLLSLINDILDIAKIEAGKIKLDLDYYSAKEISEASLRLVKQLAHEKELQINFTIDENISLIEVDSKRLKQILVNLLSNAIKFTPNKKEIGLDVIGDAENETVDFIVWDHGIGISEENINRLFKPFVQLDSSLSRQYAGTGLGLTLVQRIAELHGGSVTLESTLNEGSRFTISLPWRIKGEMLSEIKEADIIESSNGTEKNIVIEDNVKQYKVLLAEDNEKNIQLIYDYLTSKNFNVIITRNGKDAVDKSLSIVPDLILMDVQMPEMNGIDAIHHIRGDAKLKNIPIFALTALVMPGDKEKSLKSGADEYLKKPISMKMLLKLINKYLSI